MGSRIKASWKEEKDGILFVRWIYWNAKCPTKNVARLHPEVQPFDHNLETQVDEDGAHENHLRDEHRVRLDRRVEESADGDLCKFYFWISVFNNFFFLNSLVILVGQADAEGHLGDAQNDAELHFHGVGEVELILRKIPNWVQAKLMNFFQ